MDTTPRFVFKIFTLALVLFSVHTQVSYAGAGGTVTRGDTKTIGWSVGNAPSCEASTDYPSNIGDGVYTAWVKTQDGANNLLLPKITAVPGVYRFTCGIPNGSGGYSASDYSDLTVTDCTGGKTWNDTTKTCVATASFTSTPSCEITANLAGCGPTVSWTSSGAGSVTLTDCGGTPHTTTGTGAQSFGVYVPFNSGCYQIREGGNVLAQATIASSCIAGTAWSPSGNVCTAPPTLTFGTSGTIDYNTASTLTWTPGSNPTSCTASGDWSGAKAIGGGSVSTGNLTSGKTYTLQCGNEAGDSPLRTVTVAVNCVTPWGTKVVNGNQVTSYETATVNAPSSCVSEQRTCTDGTLGGSYTNQSCVVKSGSISITDLSGTPTSSCVISANQSTCQVRATWTQSNLSSPAFYDANTGTNLGGTSGVAQTVYVAGGYPTGSTAFYLTDSTAFHYADTSVTSSCISGTNVGTTWNGTMCVLPTGTLTPTTPL